MPAGKHRQKLRRIARSLDAVLEEEREKEQPIPPPINEEHALLRKRMEEASQIFCDAKHSEDTGPETEMIGTPEAIRAAVSFIEMTFKEQRLLADHGFDWRSWQR